MQPADFQMNEMLEFMPEQGKVFFKGSRAMIIDAASLGMLRKDLIDTLGMDRAKGFLIRYGWSCGFQTAMSLKKQISSSQEQMLNHSGPTMHTLQGFAQAQLAYRIDKHTGSLYYDGYWNNSFEAEQHILHFGFHHEPVCWNLVGYASGYSSAIAGKRIIYKEIECTGKGDQHCTFIGKTLEDWGEEILPELRYYETHKINEELQDAHRRIKKQNKVMERIIYIHEQLTQCILNGNGVDQITSTFSEVMKCTVMVEDRYFSPLSVYIPHYLNNKDLLAPYLSLSSSSTFNQDLILFLTQKRPFQITDHISGLTIYRLVSPILVRNHLLGFVSLLRAERPFNELEHKASEHAASVFALEITKKKELLEVENRLKGDFIGDLLAGNFSEPNSIIQRALVLNYDITAPHRILVLTIENMNKIVKDLKLDEKKLFKYKSELVNFVQSVLERLGKGMVIDKNDSLIMLVQTSKTNKAALEAPIRELAGEIVNAMKERTPHIAVSVGIGSSCTQLSDFAESLLSAQKAIEIGKALNRQGQIVSLEQFGAHALLFSAFNPTDLYAFTRKQLGSLIEYDEKYQTQFIFTLQEYVNQRGSIERTARSMNLSVSGLKYRLQRIEEIIEIDLKDAQAFFNLHLALNILQLAGQEQISP